MNKKRLLRLSRGLRDLKVSFMYSELLMSSLPRLWGRVGKLRDVRLLLLKAQRDSNPAHNVKTSWERKREKSLLEESAKTFPIQCRELSLNNYNDYEQKLLQLSQQGLRDSPKHFSREKITRAAFLLRQFRVSFCPSTPPLCNPLTRHA